MILQKKYNSFFTMKIINLVPNLELAFSFGTLNLSSSSFCNQFLKVLVTIPYFTFHFFPHMLIFLQFRDPSYVLNLSTKAVLQKWRAREPNICSLN